MKRFNEIKGKMQQKAKKISQSIEDELRANQKRNSTNTSKTSYHYSSSGDHSSPEQIIGTMYSYFVAFWVGTIISAIAFVMLLPSPKTWFLAVMIIIAWPFWAVFCLVMMIPEVRIFGVTIFSRRNLSLRQSVSFGKRILYTFSREFYQSNPTMATILFFYLLLVIIAIGYAIF